MRVVGLTVLVMLMSGCTIHVANEPATAAPSYPIPVAVAAPGTAPEPVAHVQPRPSRRPAPRPHAPPVASNEPPATASGVTTPIRTKPGGDLAGGLVAAPREPHGLRRFRDTKPQARDARKTPQRVEARAPVAVRRPRSTDVAKAQ